MLATILENSREKENPPSFGSKVWDDSRGLEIDGLCKKICWLKMN